VTALFAFMIIAFLALVPCLLPEEPPAGDESSPGSARQRLPES